MGAFELIVEFEGTQSPDIVPGFFIAHATEGNTSGSQVQVMTHDTQMHLLLLSELVFALRANDPETFKRWLAGGIQDLGKPAIEELMIEWLNPLLTQDEADRLVGWYLGVSL